MKKKRKKAIEIKNLEILVELRAILKEKLISPETAARFLPSRSSRQIRRWLDGEYVPNFESRRAIRKAIDRIKKNL